MIPHPSRIPIQKPTALFFCNIRVKLHAQAVVFYLFLQSDVGKVIIVVPYPELVRWGKQMFRENTQSILSTF